MDMITYISALLAVFLLLGLFALVMRQVTQGRVRTRSLSHALSNTLPAGLRRFLPRALRLQATEVEEGFAIAAVRMIDARVRIVAVDYREKRYIILLSHQGEQLLDTLPVLKPKQRRATPVKNNA